MICFRFYLLCLNDKEKGLKSSISKKTIFSKFGNPNTHMFQKESIFQQKRD